MRTLTCQGLDAGTLKEPRRAVLVVPVIHIPAVVHVAVLLLDLNVVIVCGHRGRHPDGLSCLSTSAASQSSVRTKGKAQVCIQGVQPRQAGEARRVPAACPDVPSRATANSDLWLCFISHVRPGP